MMAVYRCLAIILCLAVVSVPGMLSSDVSADIPVDTGVIVRLDNCDIHWDNTFSPYSVYATNDTANFNTLAGEYGLQVWADDQIDLYLTKWYPYSYGPYGFELTGSGANARFNLSGLQPWAVYRLTIGDASSIVSADEQGRITWNVSAITEVFVQLDLISTTPIFTSSPEIAIYSQGYVWSYDIRVFPTKGIGPKSDVKITIEQKPSWMTYEYNIWQLHGTPPHVGQYDVHIRATNVNGNSWQNFTVFVYAEDIGITSSPLLSIQKFDQYRYEVKGYPSYAQYKAIAYPSWLHWNTFTHTFDGQALKSGSYKVNISISTNDRIAYQSWTITVNDQPHEPGWSDTKPWIGSDLSLLYMAIGGGAMFCLLIMFFFARRR